MNVIFLHCIIAVCASHCGAGCTVNGAGKCDRCDDGFGLTVDKTCNGENSILVLRFANS